MATERSAFVNYGLRLSPAVHDELRLISYVERISISKLLLEGAELVLAARLGPASQPAPQPTLQDVA